MEAWFDCCLERVQWMKSLLTVCTLTESLWVLTVGIECTDCELLIVSLTLWTHSCCCCCTSSNPCGWQNNRNTVLELLSVSSFFFRFLAYPVSFSCWEIKEEIMSVICTMFAVWVSIMHVYLHISVPKQDLFICVVSLRVTTCWHEPSRRKWMRDTPRETFILSQRSYPEFEIQGFMMKEEII